MGWGARVWCGWTNSVRGEGRIGGVGGRRVPGMDGWMDACVERCVWVCGRCVRA